MAECMKCLVVKGETPGGEQRTTQARWDGENKDPDSLMRGARALLLQAFGEGWAVASYKLHQGGVIIESY